MVMRTSPLGASHKAIILATDAAAKPIVAKNKEKDQKVKLPKREMKASLEIMHMPTMYNRLSTAINGHNNILSSAGRCFLHRKIQNGT